MKILKRRIKLDGHGFGWYINSDYLYACGDGLGNRQGNGYTYGKEYGKDTGDGNGYGLIAFDDYGIRHEDTSGYGDGNGYGDGYSEGYGNKSFI